MNVSATGPERGIDADVLIAGGGHVGLSLALALRRAAPRLRVTLVDAAPPGAEASDTRASAVAAAGRRMLDHLGVWDEIAADAQPISDMIITDSRTRDAVRPVFLTFAETGNTDGPFAHMVMNGTMVGALRRAAVASGAVLVAPDSVTDFAVDTASVKARLASGATISVRLLVAADGVRSLLRDIAGIATLVTSYGQAGIVATVGHDRPHHGRAEEHFLPGGPFALLPLAPDASGNRSSLVWTEPREAAERLVAGDPLVFQVELERRLGHRLGRLRVLDKPRAFPLDLTLARSFVKPRFALAGDAAHGIHPIAGQGLNLGFRDVAALAETIVEADRLGLDIGALTVLGNYERWRRFDTLQMGLTTDVLNRLFSNDSAALRLFRDVGLGLVDRMPGLKRLFTREAAGEEGELPRLLRGEAI
jgi:2-octaprenyl-6-methoxyphenol hydroxylase